MIEGVRVGNPNLTIREATRTMAEIMRQPLSAPVMADNFLLLSRLV